MKAVRHHLTKHIRTFLIIPPFFLAQIFSSFPSLLQKLRQVSPFVPNGVIPVPPSFQKVKAVPVTTAGAPLSLKPAVPAVPSTFSLPPSQCRSWAFPMGALPVHAPTTPGQNGTHGTVPEDNQILPASSTQSAAWVWCQPPDRTNRKDLGWQLCHQHSSLCSGCYMQAERWQKTVKQLWQELHRKGGSSHHRQLHILSESHVCNIAR